MVRNDEVSLIAIWCNLFPYRPQDITLPDSRKEEATGANSQMMPKMHEAVLSQKGG